ncbi:unnamed protein product [Trichobilharzia regenti]|nr:unnamed protein product [Trichobilharzia regenti]
MKEGYNILIKRAKKSAREEKRKYCEAMATEKEQAAGKGDLATPYQATQTKPVKDDNGKSITKEVEQRKHWAGHFKRLLNRLPPTTRPIIPTTEAELPVNISPPTKTEISKAIKILKNEKAAGPNGIPTEALKMDA